MDYTRALLRPEATISDVLQTGTRTPDWGFPDNTAIKIDKPYLKTWKSKDKGTVIRFIQDPLREVRYFHLTGANLAHHLAVIRKRVPTCDRTEFGGVMRAAKTPAEKGAAVYRAAILAPARGDTEILDFLTRALTDPAPLVRRAAIDATLVALWPDLRGPLERVAAEDPDGALREFAGETLARLRDRFGDVPTPGGFDSEPLPPDPLRITELFGLGTAWYVEALGRQPPPRVGAAGPGSGAPGKPAKPFDPPSWLAALMRAGDWAGFQWHTAEQIQAAANHPTEYKRDSRLALSPHSLQQIQSLYPSMIPVADGPEFTDRTGRVEKSRLYVNRDDPERLLLALGLNHPPSEWAPAGQTRASVDAVVTAYFFPGVPPQATLPFQARLFLDTQATIQGEFEDVENRVIRNPFTDMLTWGSSQPTDPYSEQVALGQIPVDELRRFIAQDPGVLPRTSIRTRFSRSVIQLVDYRGAFFADLFFRPIDPAEWAGWYNTRFGTDFPPRTPVDVIGALSGFGCIGPDRIRPQAEAADDPDERRRMEEIIAFLVDWPPRPVGNG